MLTPAVSLNAPLGDGLPELGDVLMDTTVVDGAVLVANADRATDVWVDIRRHLTQRDYRVVALRLNGPPLGDDGWPDFTVPRRDRVLTYREVGEAIDVGEDQARKLFNTAIARLRHPYRSALLRDHDDQAKTTPPDDSPDEPY